MPASSKREIEIPARGAWEHGERGGWDQHVHVTDGHDRAHGHAWLIAPAEHLGKHETAQATPSSRWWSPRWPRTRCRPPLPTTDRRPRTRAMSRSMASMAFMATPVWRGDLAHEHEERVGVKEKLAMDATPFRKSHPDEPGVLAEPHPGPHHVDAEEREGGWDADREENRQRTEEDGSPRSTRDVGGPRQRGGRRLRAHLNQRSGARTRWRGRRSRSAPGRRATTPGSRLTLMTRGRLAAPSWLTARAP